MKVGDFYRRNVKMLLYGASGVGKTYLASRLNNALIIDIEGGLLSAPRDMEFLPIPSLGDAFNGKCPSGSVATRAETVEELNRIYQLLAKSGRGRFETVILDSITEVQKRVQEYLTRKFSDAVTQKFRSDDGSTENFHVLTQQGWMALQNKTRSGFRMYRDLEGMNVVFVCSEETVTDSEGVAYTQPLLDGRKNLPDLEYMVDVGIRLHQTVSRTAKGLNIVRMFQCARTPTVWAKVRGGLLNGLEPVAEGGLQTLIEKISSGALPDSEEAPMSEPETPSDSLEVAGGK